MPLDHVGTAALAGRLFAVGGYGAAGTPTTGVYAYDPRTDRWSARAPLPVARAAAVAVALGGRLHLVGGRGPAGDTGRP